MTATVIATQAIGGPKTRTNGEIKSTKIRVKIRLIYSQILLKTPIYGFVFEN